MDKTKEKETESKGWIGVDLDGTLAYYDHWQGESHIGDPIPLMVARVKTWLEQGVEVKLVTAREKTSDIEEWCLKHIGQILEVTDRKDFNMIELWDDRCVSVIPNSGISHITAMVEALTRVTRGILQ